MKKVTEIVAELALAAVEEAGCTLWDTEYVREAGQWYLRLYLDKEGGVNITDCEAVSRKVRQTPFPPAIFLKFALPVLSAL